MHQALSRFIRADSHTELLDRNLIEFEDNIPENYKIKVDVYRMAAIQPGELKEEITDLSKTSIDIRNYIEAEKKDIKIKRIARFMKICAFDAYLNYSRNFRKSDKDFSKAADYSVAYPKIWKSRGKPGNTHREGLALNQGPCEKELVYNTYNLFYADKKDRTKLISDLYNIFSDTEFYPIDGILKILKQDIKYDHYKIFNFILEQINPKEDKKENRSRENLFEYELNVLGSNLYVSRKNLENYNNFLSTENYYSFMEFKSKETTQEDIFKEEKLQKMYKKLEGKSKESIIEIYQKDQNYGDYKLLLEDSIIRLKENIWKN